MSNGDDRPDVTSPSQYAQMDEDGNWRAGPASEKYETGQYVTDTYANRVRKNARRRLLVSNIQFDTGKDRDEAREVAEEFLEREQEIKDEYGQQTQEQRLEREAELRQLRRELLGS